MMRHRIALVAIPAVAFGLTLTLGVFSAVTLYIYETQQTSIPLTFLTLAIAVAYVAAGTVSDLITFALETIQENRRDRKEHAHV